MFKNKLFAQSEPQTNAAILTAKNLIFAEFLEILVATPLIIVGFFTKNGD